QDGEQVATLGVVDFEDYNYLAKFGENLYDMVDGGTRIASTATVNQGCIEASNVNVVSEMVNMITITRAYQAGQKVINAVDETLDKAVNQVGKV
ncbi:MAG: flagellar basal body and hook protein, partial [Roseburia sp.]|nr:flagellar basal body and hook protein [Roseburia sp.]